MSGWRNIGGRSQKVWRRDCAAFLEYLAELAYSLRDEDVLHEAAEVVRSAKNRRRFSRPLPETTAWFREELTS